jgi:hypothetical protein
MRNEECGMQNEEQSKDKLGSFCAGAERGGRGGKLGKAKGRFVSHLDAL